MTDLTDKTSLSPGEQHTKPAAFFQEVYEAFLLAEQAVGGAIDRFYEVGGFTIRLRFAGPALIPFITPALEHLAAMPVPAPTLTICLWDSVSTRTEMPPCPWTANDYIARAEVRGYSGEHIHTAFYLGSGILHMLDTTLNVALLWIRDASLVPYFESAAPLRPILHWWMGNHGRQLVHGGAVGTSEGGVLLTGKGGSGKSTTALACLHSKLAYAGDDYCLVAIDPVPYAYSLYNSAKLDADGVRRLLHLATAISNADRLDAEKALLFLHECYPERIATGFPVRVILVPRVTGQWETRLTAASPMMALRALAPSTILRLSGAGSKDFQAMAKFVKRVPCYTLELGADLNRVPDVILRLLSES